MSVFNDIWNEIKRFYNLSPEEKDKLTKEFNEKLEKMAERYFYDPIPTQEDRENDLQKKDSLITFENDRREVQLLMDQGIDVHEAVEIVLKQRQSKTKSEFRTKFDEAYDNAKPIPYHPKFKNFKNEDRIKAEEFRKKGRQVFHPWFPSNFDLILQDLHDEALLDSLNYKRLPFVTKPTTVYPYARPITLIIDSDCLYDNKLGIRTGALLFLAEATQFAEVILIGTQSLVFGELKGIDETELITIDTQDLFFKKKVTPAKIRDLRYVIRDPKRTIIIDTDTDNVICNPENAVIIPKYVNDKSKRNMINLVYFIEDLATKIALSGEKGDVRKFLERYQNIEFDFFTQYQKVKRTATGLF